MAFENRNVTNDAVAVTPHATNLQPGYGFRVGTTAGAVEIITAYGTTTVIPNVQIGETIVVNFTHILAANTTAEGITRFVDR